MGAFCRAGSCSDVWSITEIRRDAYVNRTAFYDNDLDIYDLADLVQNRAQGGAYDIYAAIWSQLQLRQNKNAPHVM